MKVGELPRHQPDGHKSGSIGGMADAVVTKGAANLHLYTPRSRPRPGSIRGTVHAGACRLLPMDVLRCGLFDHRTVPSRRMGVDTWTHSFLAGRNGWGNPSARVADASWRASGAIGEPWLLGDTFSGLDRGISAGQIGLGPIVQRPMPERPGFCDYNRAPHGAVPPRGRARPKSTDAADAPAAGWRGLRGWLIRDQKGPRAVASALR